MAKDIGMTAVLHDYIVLQSSLNDIFVVNRMDLTIAIQVLKGTVSFALSLELGKTWAGSSLSKYKSQVKINSQQLQSKQMTASIATVVWYPSRHKRIGWQRGHWYRHTESI